MSGIDGESQQEGRPEAVVLNVQLEGDRKDLLYVKSDDNPKVLARNFAAKHKLDIGLRNTLEMMINEHLALFHTPPSLIPSKNPSTKTIHNRLYMDSKLTKRKPTKKLDLPKPSSPSTINYGQVLYDQSKTLTKHKSREILIQKRTQAEKESKELTFHPNIPNNMSTSTTNSEFFVKNQGIQRSQYAPMATREMQECSFQPKINPNTQSSKNIHEKLYRQGLAKHKTSKISTQVTLNPEEREACVNRLLTSHLRTEARLLKSRMKEKGNLDPDTQKPRFVPEIGREPQSPLDQPVWQRLYGKEEKPAEEQLDIYKAHRVACYKQIFEAATETEVLNSEMLQEADLDSGILRVLKKVVGKSLELGVNFDGFVEIMENGVCYLNIQDRVTLLKRQIC